MKSSKVLTKLRSKIRGQTVFISGQRLNETLKFDGQIQSYTDKRFAKTRNLNREYLNKSKAFVKVTGKRYKKFCLTKTRFCSRTERVRKLNKVEIKQVVLESKPRALTVRFSNNSFRQREKYKIIRPLLDFKRESITMICKQFKMPVYPDQSNKSIQYSRNRIRKQIIPSIKYFLNPQLENSLFKMAVLLDKEQSFLYSVLKNSSIDMHL